MEIEGILYWGYALSIYLVLSSSVVSAIELSAVPAHYFSFIYPKISSLIVQKSRWVIVHTIQVLLAIASGVLFYFEYVSVFKVAFAGLSILSLYCYVKRAISKDGADQIRILTLLSFSFCFVLNDHDGKLVSLIFMGCQGLLGYSTSAIAKLASPYWRKGNVLHLIFGTYAYGIPKLSNFLRNHPKLERLLAHGAIAMMLAVPLSFGIPSPYAIAIALVGIFSFHFATAVIMGLNDFLMTFPVVYPGIILLHGLLHNYITL